MTTPKALVRGVLLVIVSIGILAAPLVLSVSGTGNARAEQPAMTLSGPFLSGPAAAASHAIQPPRATSTPGNGAAGELVSYKRAPLQAPVTYIVISEFATTGPGSADDEFVELFNPSSGPIDISGWTINSSDCSGGGTIAPILGTVTLQAGEHYLVGGLGYTGTGPASADNSPLVDLSLADNGGIALEDSSSAIVDAVGFCAAGPSDYSEGTLLTSQLTSPQSYERKFGGAYGSCLDNNDNTTDFALIQASDPQNSSVTPRLCVYPTISGTTGVAGVTSSYVEGLAMPPVISGVGGAYSIQVADGWSGTVTPSLAGYTFNPLSRTYVGSAASIVSQDYAAALSTATPASFAAMSIVINEVGWAGTSNGSADQYIELYNTTSSAIDLGAIGTSGDGWVLSSPSWQTASYVHLRGIIPAHGFFLLVHDTATAATEQATSTATAQASSCVVLQFSNGLAYDQVFTSTLSPNGQILFLSDPNGNLEDTADRTGVPMACGFGDEPAQHGAPAGLRRYN